MSVEMVKEYLRRRGKDKRVLEFAESCATVELAAKVLGVGPARIAKTLSFKAAQDDGDPAAPCCIMVVAAGDARIDGKKFKNAFGVKSKMLSPEEVLACTGHAVGGVCPFAVQNPNAGIYLDVSLRRFASVFPACGSSNSLAEFGCEELFEAAGALAWVDVCKDWSE